LRRLPASDRAGAVHVSPSVRHGGTTSIYHEGPWKGLQDVAYATLAWVAWYNSLRLMEPLGYLPPTAYEEQYHRVQADQSPAALN